jgi:hypothetical protein
MGPLALSADLRAGLHVLRAPEELADVEFDLRMINTGKLLRQCTVLGFDDRAASETTVPFFGVKLRIVPFDRYAEEFAAVPIDDAARRLIARFTGGAKEQRDITDQSLENAARAHFALTNSRAMADRLLAAAGKLDIPVVFYIGLGVCHGPGTSFRGYRRPGVHFIMSLENLEAIEEGLRMVKEGTPLGQGPWPSPAS